MRNLDEIERMLLKKAHEHDNTASLGLTVEEIEFYQRQKRLEAIEKALKNDDLQEAAHCIDLAGNWKHLSSSLLLEYADRFKNPHILFNLIISVYTNDGYNFPKSLIMRAKRLAKEIPQEERLAGLPKGKTITIYRGSFYTNPAYYRELKTEISWTINKACAVWFANRGNGAVWEGTIDRNKIIAYTNLRNEYEVIQHMNVQNPHVCEISPEEWNQLLDERNKEGTIWTN